MWKIDDFCQVLSYLDVALLDGTLANDRHDSLTHQLAFTCIMCCDNVYLVNSTRVMVWYSMSLFGEQEVALCAYS